MMRAAKPHRFSAPRQQGVALLLAMLIVTLVSTLAAGMVWQQWRAFEVESATRLRQQARWLTAGALDWAMVVLRTDARSSGETDTLTEIWAQGLEETSLATFLAADKNNNADLTAQTSLEAFLSGHIEDAQGRYNLRNLLSSTGARRQAQQAILERLCDSVGLPRSTAERVAQLLRAARVAEQQWSQEGAQGSATAGLPLRPRRFSQLRWLGLDDVTLEKLRPLVTLLPRPTPVNLNTASVDVLAAVIPGMDRASAQRLAQERLTRRRGFEQVEDARPFLPAQYKPEQDLGVGTMYFEITAQLRYEGHLLREVVLVRRQGEELRVLWRESVAGIP